MRKWSGEYEINSLLLNNQGRLGLFSLLNLLQDAAILHGEILGYGRESSLQKKLFWVLTRQKVAMESWPAWKSKVEIRTWMKPVTGLVAEREFEIIQAGKRIGACVTTWLPLSAETRKPVKVDRSSIDESRICDETTGLTAKKIELVEIESALSEYRVRNSDIDMNNHVNNTRYAQWVLDAIPASGHRRFRLLEYEVNFLAETHVDDIVTIGVHNENLVDPLRIQFQGRRAADKKIVFASRIAATPND